nr:alpha/beta hydrolase [Algoriphagus sp.]
MPIIDSSSYQGPSYLINGHFETIVPSLFRKIKELTYEREKIHTPDDDFLNL